MYLNHAANGSTRINVDIHLITNTRINTYVYVHIFVYMLFVDVCCIWLHGFSTFFLFVECGCVPKALIGWSRYWPLVLIPWAFRIPGCLGRRATLGMDMAASRNWGPFLPCPCKKSSGILGLCIRTPDFWKLPHRLPCRGFIGSQ